MADCHSLYLQVHIQPQQLQAFLNSPVQDTPVDADWRSWWQSRSAIAPYELVAVPKFPEASYRQVIHNILSDKQRMARQYYNNQTQSWELAALQYAENYVEILPLLALVKTLATFTVAGSGGAALLVDYLWGDRNVMAYLRIEDRKAFFTPFKSTAELPAPLIRQGSVRLAGLMDELQR